MQFFLLKRAATLFMMTTTLLFSLTIKANNLTINVNDITLIEGVLIVEVMDKTFYQNDVGEGVIVNKILVSKNTHSITIDSLPAGEYAVLVYQDINNNDELDFSFFSGPEEPTGASNNPKSSFGPPSWGKVMLVKTKEDKLVEIKLSTP